MLEMTGILDSATGVLAALWRASLVDRWHDPRAATRGSVRL
jgi:hypothetical protein